MTEPAASAALSMKQRKKYSAQKNNSIEKYHPHKMHCSSALDEHSIKLEYNRPRGVWLDYRVRSLDASVDYPS